MIIYYVFIIKYDHIERIKEKEKKKKRKRKEIVHDPKLNKLLNKKRFIQKNSWNDGYFVF
jgi:hypothetical protein